MADGWRWCSFEQHRRGAVVGGADSTFEDGQSCTISIRRPYVLLNIPDEKQQQQQRDDDNNVHGQHIIWYSSTCRHIPLTTAHSSTRSEGRTGNIYFVAVFYKTSLVWTKFDPRYHTITKLLVHTGTTLLNFNKKNISALVGFFRLTFTCVMAQGDLGRPCPHTKLTA